MRDGWKSVAVAVAIMFVFLVVLEGDLVGGGDGFFVRRKSFSFCDGWLGDAPVLEALPCFVLNLGVIFATLFGLMAIFAVARLFGGMLQRSR